ncbi:MAG TPA: ABC transporter substrate-binding protein [Thermomicrobiales bacterium]|nr:ABC transporter substrate-binding protein [Thermomicrobiales bacterium]
MATDTGEQQFDQRMRAYLAEIRAQSVSRRGLIKGSAAVAGAAAMAGTVPFLAPGVSVLAQIGDTITMGLEADLRGVEPALGYDFTANPVICNITEGLMALDKNSALYPLLAESFENPDAQTFIYNIRPGVTFHDGTVLTAADAIASIGRVREPAIASPMAWMFDQVETIEQTGDAQITIKLKVPSASFPYVMATTAGHVMPKALIDSTPDLPTLEPIGTGPYKFVSWEAGSQVELTKHDAYWQSGKPYFKTAIFKIVPDGTTRVAGLSTGDLNIVRDIPPDQLSIVKAMPDVTFQEVVGFTSNQIFMVNNAPPFDDAKVREAVSLAINYDDIMTNLVGDTGVRSISSTVPSTMPGSAESELTAVPFDLEAAKAALAASSQPNGFKTTITVDAESSQRSAEAQAIQQMLAEIGVELEIQEIPGADRITALQTGEYEGMIFHEWGADFPDANGMLLPLFHSRSVPPQNNGSFYNNPQVDALLDAADADVSEARLATLIEAQKLIAADMPIIWLDHFKWFLPMSAGLTGYSIGPLFYWDSFLRDLVPEGA